MKQRVAVWMAACVLGIALSSAVHGQSGAVLYHENFDGLTLGPSVNERQTPPVFALSTAVATDPTTQPRPNAFTHTPPAGWMVDNDFDNFGQTDLTNPNYATGFIVGNTGVPNQGSEADGVDEWEGWSFANKNFWSSVDDQNRSQFTKATGTVAVADSDEYDDLGAGRGGLYYNTGLTTKPIDVSAFNNGTTTITLDLDSSWRPEGFDDVNANLGTAQVNNQTAIIYTSFDGSAPEPIDFWDSQSGSPTFKGDSTNEHISDMITVPAGVHDMKLTFAYVNAANDWWWAIDNIKLSKGGNQFFLEDFESLPLGPSVNERQALVPAISKVTAANNDAATAPRPSSFTHTGPAGWTVDNSGINPIARGDNNRGVFEWEGWTFTTREFWQFASQTDAASFTNGTGTIAVADSDEFADFGATSASDPAGTGDVTRPMSTILKSPSINIAGVPANDLYLQFDSCWRPEDTANNQTAEITVDYGSGPVVVLHWDSNASSPDFHGIDAAGAANLNENVLIPLNNPAGATTAQLAFRYLNGSNNWFWAIDNIQVGTMTFVPPASSADFNHDGRVNGADLTIWRNSFGSGNGGDANGDGVTNGADFLVWQRQIKASIAAVPEPSAIVMLLGCVLWRLSSSKRRCSVA